jgi:hypothetical protein
MITTISFILNSRATVAGLLRPKRMQVHPQQRLDMGRMHQGTW